MKKIIISAIPISISLAILYFGYQNYTLNECKTCLETADFAFKEADYDSAKKLYKKATMCGSTHDRAIAGLVACKNVKENSETKSSYKTTSTSKVKSPQPSSPKQKSQSKSFYTTTSSKVKPPESRLPRSEPQSKSFHTTKSKVSFESTYTISQLHKKFGHQYDYMDNDIKDKLVVVRKDEKYGFINTQGKVQIPLIYDGAKSFSEGLAVVYRTDMLGFKNIQRKVTASLIYDFTLSFQNGTIKKNRKYGFINTKGEVVIPLIYDYAYYFSEGLAIVREGSFKNGKYGFINRQGKIQIPLIYDDAFPFNMGLTRVRKDGKSFTINKKGECVKDCP